MPELASTRLGLEAHSGGDAVATIDDTTQALVAQLEAVTAGFLQGTSRPAAAAALQGFLYVHTGTGLVSYCTGSVWVDINPTGVYDPVGTGAAAAAAAQAAAIAASQPLDADLTALAGNGAPGVTGLALLLAASATAARNILGAAALHTVTSPSDITGHTTYDSDVAITGIAAVTVTPPDTSSKYRYKIEHQGLSTNVGAYTLRLGFLKDGSVFKYKQWVAYTSRMGDNFEYVHSPASVTPFTIQPFWRHQTGTGASDLIGPQFTIEKIA